MLNDVNEQDTSFLDCKHMMKRGAPPDNSDSYRMLPIEIDGFTSRIDF